MHIKQSNFLFLVYFFLTQETLRKVKKLRRAKFDYNSNKRKLKNSEFIKCVEEIQIIKSFNIRPTV